MRVPRKLKKKRKIYWDNLLRSKLFVSTISKFELDKEEAERVNNILSK